MVCTVADELSLPLLEDCQASRASSPNWPSQPFLTRFIGHGHFWIAAVCFRAWFSFGTEFFSLLQPHDRFFFFFFFFFCCACMCCRAEFAGPTKKWYCPLPLATGGKRDTAPAATDNGPYFGMPAREFLIKMYARRHGACGNWLDDSGDVRPIWFASRSLRRNGAGGLAVKYGCLKFDHYLSGDPQFTVHTDHKPLLQLLRLRSCPRPRIERMVLAGQDLSFALEYNPGTGKPADVLSRHSLPLPLEPNAGEIDDAQYIAANLRAATPNSVTPECTHVVRAGGSELRAVLARLETSDWRPTNSSEAPFVPSLHLRTNCQPATNASFVPWLWCRSVSRSCNSPTKVTKALCVYGLDKNKKSLISTHVIWCGTSRGGNAEHVLRLHHLVTTNCSLKFPTPAATCPFQYVSTDLYGPLPKSTQLLKYTWCVKEKEKKPIIRFRKPKKTISREKEENDLKICAYSCDVTHSLKQASIHTSHVDASKSCTNYCTSCNQPAHTNAIMLYAVKVSSDTIIG